MFARIIDFVKPNTLVTQTQFLNAASLPNNTGYDTVLKYIAQNRRNSGALNVFDEDGNTALHRAVEHNNFSIVSSLITQDGVAFLFNKKGETVLHVAVFANLTKLVQDILLPHMTEDDILTTDLNGRTPLDIAIDKNFLQLNQILMDRISSDRLAPDLFTLMVAPEDNSNKIKPILLKHPVLINKTDDEGNTLLIWACHCQRTHHVKLLLEQEGIQSNKANKFGDTALIIAAKIGHKEIVILLLASLTLADILHKNQQQEDAETKASHKNHQEIVAIIRARIQELRKADEANKVVIPQAVSGINQDNAHICMFAPVRKVAAPIAAPVALPVQRF